MKTMHTQKGYGFIVEIGREISTSRMELKMAQSKRKVIQKNVTNDKVYLLVERRRSSLSDRQPCSLAFRWFGQVLNVPYSAILFLSLIKTLAKRLFFIVNRIKCVCVSFSGFPICVVDVVTLTHTKRTHTLLVTLVLCAYMEIFKMNLMQSGIYTHTLTHRIYENQSTKDSK